METIAIEAEVGVRAPITITEFKAPTDESIRLLEEMKEKTLQSIVHSFGLSDNILNGVAVTICLAPLGKKVRFLGRFFLNGEEHTFDKEVNYTFDKVAMISELCGLVAKAITEKLLKEVMKTDEWRMIIK